MSPTTHACTLPATGGDGSRIALEHLPAASAEHADGDAAGGAVGVLFCGGFHSTMQGDKARAVARFCAAAGIACTRFDYRGHGASEGDARRLTLLDWLDDTLTVIDHLARERPSTSPASGTASFPTSGTGPGASPSLVVVGSSMGAWLAVQAASRRPGRVRALLLVAAAPDFLQDTLPERLDAAARARLAAGLDVTLASPYDEAGWPVTPALIESGRTLSLLTGDTAREVRCAVRMLHGDRDDTAPLSRAQALFSRLGSDDATLTVLKGGDHRLSTPASLALLDTALAGLLRR